MNKYKINFIYSKETIINDIFTKVLKKELKKYVEMICKNDKKKVTSTCTYLSLQDKEGNIWGLM